jgi:hypothetical protein
MKRTLKLLLTLSLLTNLVLLSYVAKDSLRTGDSLQPPNSGGAAALTADKAERSSAKAPIWQNLVAGDAPAQWTQTLKNAGFPDKIIQAIVAAQIHEQFAARRTALQLNDTAQYWNQNWNNWFSGDAKTRTALRALWKEERQAIKTALGDSYNESPEHKKMYERQFGPITKDKIDALQTITEDYQELTSEIYQTANGFMLPEDREKLAFLEKEKRADMAALLTPQELSDVEVRSSQTAGTLRHQLKAFGPSEQEFRAIFSLQRDFELQFGDRRSSANDEAAQKQRSEAEAALQNKIQASLGTARYTEYQRSKDGNYQQISSLTERLALPKENAITVYELSKDVQKRTQEIRSDPNLKGEARNTALTALASEVTAKVTAALGETGYAAYKENGGYWLQNIAPRPSPKPKTP